MALFPGLKPRVTIPVIRYADFHLQCFIRYGRVRQSFSIVMGSTSIFVVIGRKSDFFDFGRHQSNSSPFRKTTSAKKWFSSKREVKVPQNAFTKVN